MSRSYDGAVGPKRCSMAERDGCLSTFCGESVVAEPLKEGDPAVRILQCERRRVGPS